MPRAGWQTLRAALFVGSEVSLGLLPLRLFPGKTDPTFLGAGKVCGDARGLLLEVPGELALTPRSRPSPGGERAYENTEHGGKDS